MKTLVIGDIHGCYEELQTLLDKAGVADDDRIITVGDMVNRGPDSARALNFFRMTPGAESILGNHEHNHLRAWDGEKIPTLSMLLARWELDDDYEAAIAYMNTLPLFIETPDAIITHGFWEPGVPLEEQRPEVLLGSSAVEMIFWDRYGQPWYELYDGHKPLIVGHRDYSGGAMKPLVDENRVWGIDTRCVYGGSLSGILLPDWRLVSVPAREDHWSAIQQQWCELPK